MKGEEEPVIFSFPSESRESKRAPRKLPDQAVREPRSKYREASPEKSTTHRTHSRWSTVRAGTTNPAPVDLVATTRLEMLSRDNYDTWRIQAEALLVKNDHWGYVSAEEEQPVVEGAGEALLETIYASKGPVRKVTLLKRLKQQKMQDGDDVSKHLTEFFDAVDKLKSMKIDINGELLTIMLLYSLPISFEKKKGKRDE
ncbi:hypothetical protein TcasGA2_TC001835 [Tribolium castaneum]|nr:hypothetical protein TcasGA2_TC001835 [Tribolium castaneum]